MSKTKALSILSAILLASLAGPFALAHEAEISHEEPAEATSTVKEIREITLEDLGVTRTGLLPTNPFYFVKEWERKIRLFFAGDPIKKAELEFKFTNEKAAEIKQVFENNPEDTEALEKAINNYNENVERLRTRLETLNENSGNPKVSELLESLADRTSKHQELFEDLMIKHEGLTEQLEQARGKVGEMLERMPERIREKIEKRPVACTMEAKLCPDGSYVGRVAPNCEFAPCPSEASCEGGPCPGESD